MEPIPFNHPAWIEIDLGQLRRNILAIKQYVGPQTKFCFPVKSNAYGHGLIAVAQAVQDLVDYFGVSCLQEGILLRQAKITKPILVLGAIHIEQIPELIQYDLEVTISSHYKAKLVAEECHKLNKQVKIHLEIDTGMNRTGVRVETAPKVLDFIRNHACFILKGVYSHLATADDLDHPFSAQQPQIFLDFLHQQNLINDPEVICHLANSAGVIANSQTHLDMIRPGIMTYGYMPWAEIPTALSAVKSCFALRAKVAYFKKVLQGQGVSYNHTYITRNESHILTVPVGYGDGLRRCLSNRGQVLLNGKRYPMVGNICMDQFMVDIGSDSGYVGDVITIIGKDQTQEITVEEISKLCNTITYEIVCGFTDRLPRVYLSEGITTLQNGIDYAKMTPNMA